MKFRIKITLCMIGLMSALFGAGGSLLLSVSFERALDRERNEFYSVYQMVSGTLQIIGGINGNLLYEDIADAIVKMPGQDEGLWEMIRFTQGGHTIYESGDTSLSAPGNIPDEGTCAVRMRRNNGKEVFYLSGILKTEENNVRLDMAKNVSGLFDEREDWQMIYQGVFVIMVLVCAFLSYSAAGILTRNLKRLSETAKEISSGGLSSRAEVRSADEIGQLGNDFNTMADHLEEKIRSLNDEMERRERFLGDFSHELKTPMTSIIGYADMIRSGMLGEEEEAEAADYIVREGKRLENLSMKLLDILAARNEFPDFPLTSPADLIRELEKNMAPIYAEKEILLSCSVEEGECYLEPDLVYSLILNLTENSVKAMPGTGGHICIKQIMTSEGCCIFVRDNGSGIPEDSLEHLTEAFYRVDRSRSRMAGGTGLGLALCRDITAAHDGYLRFKSRMGRGTVVMAVLKGGRNEK